MPNQVAETKIEFITAEELAASAAATQAEDYKRSPDSFLDEINAAVEELGGPAFMKAWVLKYPNEAMKLKARLLLANKEQQHVHHIQIGLPRTELDE